MAFPLFVLAMGIVAALGNTVTNIVIATAIINFPLYVRVARAEENVRRDAGFVQAARLSGNGEIRIVLMQILPNIMPIIKLLADYAKVSTTMARLADLGATRISGEMVKANTRRALMAALIPIRNDLELKLLPPGERRTFSDLVRVWSAGIEQTISRNDPQETPAPAAPDRVAVVEPAQA
jgi:hypothetical protein